MKHFKTLILGLGSTLISNSLAFGTVQTKTIEYKDGDTTLEGYLAYENSVSSKSKEKKPGVLIVHDWKGLGPYFKKRAEILAKLGYVAFAADIYGKGVRPMTPQEAGATAGKYKNDRALLRRRVAAGLAELAKQTAVNSKDLGAMGYCFGGTAVLELARSGADVKGVVSVHGGLDSLNPADAKNIKGKILILHGADDPNIAKGELKAIEDELNGAKVDWQLVLYSGAVHAFTNPEAGNDPSKGAAYNASADKRSWQALTNFFDEVLK